MFICESFVVSLSNAFKENRICTCRRVTVASKQNGDGGDMVVWAQAGCSVPSEESPALRIRELMHGGDLHSFSNPCWRH